jgi:UPF0755 protein
MDFMRKLIIILFFLLSFICLFLLFFTIPSQATQIYGRPTPSLGLVQRIQYSAQLLWYNGLLTDPLNNLGSEQSFTIQQNESVTSIVNNLDVMGFIRDAEALRAYLIYAGLDTSIQAGEYQLSTAMSAIEIAHELQDATPTEVTFVVIPGWRMEEIAASLSTSGLPITPADFFSAVNNPPRAYDFLSGEISAEGFLFPDSYILSRQITADELINELVRHFSLHLSRNIQLGFENQGLTVHQAVTLASIVEKEAVQKEEAELIASVYLNRLNIGMKLEADPTVQYSIGYNAIQGTWWTNPLSLNDLQFNSTFYTYVYTGLPPAPIANAGLDALNAVAYPAQTPYYFFQAKCDGSGFHSFSQTFEEHVTNGC